MAEGLNFYFQKLIVKLFIYLAMAYGVYAVSWLVVGIVHAFPNVEDLELALWFRDTEWHSAFVNWAITYDGRYATNFFQGFNPLVWNWITGYPWMLAFSLVLFLSGIFFSVSVFFETRWHISLVIALVFTAVFFAIIPSLVYSFYWMGSSFVYLYGSIFFMFFFSFAYLYFYEKNESLQFVYFLFSAISLFLSIGFGESFLPFYFLAFSLSFFYFLYYNKKLLLKYFPLAFIAVASAMLMVFSPGVLQRVTEHTTESYADPLILWNVFHNYIAWTIQFFKKPELYLIALFVFCLQWNQRLKISVVVSKQHWFLMLGLWLIVPCAMLLPFHLVKLSTAGFPVRIFTPVAFIQLYFFTLFILPNFIVWMKQKIKGGALLMTFGSVLFALALFLTSTENNILQIEKEFNEGKFADFKKTMTKRYALLNQNKNRSEYTLICLEALKTYPQTLYTHPDLENSRINSKWNKFLEAYFKIDEVKTPEDKTLKFAGEMQP